MNSKKRLLSDEEILKEWKKARAIFEMGANAQTPLTTKEVSLKPTAGSTLNASDSDKRVGLKEALNQAADLVDDMQNEEYTRGICELIARLFPQYGVCTSIRAEWVEQALKNALAKSIMREQLIATH